MFIHAGDFTNGGAIKELILFRNCLQAVNAGHILVVPGNHDLSFETDVAFAKSFFSEDPRVTFLIDSGIEIEGVKFWGSPWTPKFFNWAFMRKDEELKTFWDAIPSDTDVLITHCTIPVYKTLTYDLRWKQLGDLKVGEELLAFDEFPNFPVGRCYRKSIVESINFKEAPTLKVFLSDGTQFEVTENHLWLGTNGGRWNRDWLSTTQLQSNKKVGKTKCTKLRKVFDVWSDQTDWESGYIAGILDGEGFLSPQWHFDMGFAQNPGIVLDTMVSCLRNKGFNIANYPKETGFGKNCRSINIRGDIPSKLNILGAYRPKRLLQKFTLDNLNYRLRSFKDLVLVESVEVGSFQEIVELKTSTGTLIVDGFPMHNSPPYGILDKAEEDHKPLSVGSKSLLTRIMEVKPKISIFGHIHDEFDWNNHGKEEKEGIKFYNVSSYRNGHSFYTKFNPAVKIEI